MSVKKYFAYIRVSTIRQGQSGTSLIEQRSSIERYCQRYDLQIVKEYEEQETAARQGRPVFLQMIKELRRGVASGVVMHKIDRSARNLRDWAELGELIDKGIEVHFANENLDLYSRGGRLSADIQAVVAADYIRNLREEVKKGFYGRLKQGFYPLPAPLGYLDKGGGAAKEIDPLNAPLIKKAFQLYATGEYGLRSLVQKMKSLGLRTKHGQTVSANSLGVILHNPFYTGMIHLKKTGEFYEGQHSPLISRKLYDQVQDVLKGKTVTITNKKSLSGTFLFRKLLTCENCRYRLVGERQKGYLYYRCHTSECPQKTVREEKIDESFTSVLQNLQFSSEVMTGFADWFKHRHDQAEQNIEAERKALKFNLEQTRSRISRLTDALADGAIDQELFVQKKNALIGAELELKDKLAKVETIEPEALRKTERFLELANSAYLSYKMASFRNKRDLIKTLTSNFLINGKSVLIKLNLPFEMVVNWKGVLNGGPQRDSPRTFQTLLSELVEYFKQ
jgi:DNA invertase Pin-like site-specific DNA recombinase